MQLNPQHPVVRVSAALALFLTVLLLGFSWSLASHPGSSPDDDFHLSSIWCAWGAEATSCEEGGFQNGRQLVTIPALEPHVSACTIFKQAQSAACIASELEEDPPFAASANAGSYPSGFYALARLFVGDDAVRSILVMRLVSFSVCAALLIGGGLVLRSSERWRMWWFILMLSLPLGLFLFASNNPSGPTIAGCAAATAGAYAVGRRSSRGAALAPLLAAGAGVLVATQSRPDGLQFAAVAVGLGAVASFRSLSDTLRPARLIPWSLLMVALVLMWLGSSSGATLGYAPVDAESRPAGVDVVGILLDLPRLYVGEFATSLGWFDTPMPALVWGSMALVIGAVTTLGVANLTRGRTVALLLAAAAMVVVPLYMQLAKGVPVGNWVQPRYLLPLVMTFGVLLAVRPGLDSRPHAGQFAVPTAIAVVAHSVALHTTLRRSVTGLDVSSWPLSPTAEWWWHAPIGPDALWVIGSFAFAVLAALCCTMAYLAQRQVAAPTQEHLPAGRGMATETLAWTRGGAEQSGVGSSG